MQLTTHLNLMAGLRMSGAFSLFPLYAFMAWAGKTLLFTALYVLIFTFML
jgi:hypothetical protein